MSDDTITDDTATQQPDEGAQERGQEQRQEADDFKSEGSKQRVLSDLHDEREQRRRATEERDALAARVKEFEDAKLSADEKRDRELEERASRIAELEKENTDLTVRELRRQVADDEGLPSWAAARLQGSTEEELRADAATFKTNLGDSADAKPRAPHPDPSQGARSGEKPSEDDELYQQIYGTRK